MGWRTRSRPPWLPTLAALVCAALTATLGQWQWRKAELKQAMQSGYAEGRRLPALAWSEVAALGEAARYRRLRLEGSYQAGFQVLLDNRMQAGRVGYHVITPLRLDRGGSVLVNRGWLAAPPDRRQVPALPTPVGRQVVEGILVRAQGRYLELGRGEDSGQVWQNLDLERYGTWYGASGEGELPDWLLLQTSPAADGLARDWPEPELGIAKHRSYAVQWYSLSALSVGLWFYFVVLKRGTGKRDEVMEEGA